MFLLSQSLTTPERNLAFDEALVELADRYSSEGLQGPCQHEVLRLWEMPKTCVVLGRSSKILDEVEIANCEQDDVPILRRVSGGAAIVAGAGCLMYSVLISFQERPAWRMLDVAHHQVMQRIASASQATLKTLDLPGEVHMDGTCDLTLNDCKFSGNALRCKRHWMLYHGTILISMPLEWIDRYLKQPPRQPTYRQNREHRSFVTRLVPESSKVAPIAVRRELESQLALAWSAHSSPATSELQPLLEQECTSLMEKRYSQPAWHSAR